jgi:tRNA A-37 threonylcarbamoyl transferase component Bud32
MQQLGKYRLEAEIARGAYGIVHRATDLEMDRAVALKVLRDDAPSASTLERFLREARLAAALDHPNIVRVYGSGVIEGRAFIAMELLEGETLQERLARGRVPEREAASIGEALARALDHAHRRGVIHRDIKPANVLLAGRGPVLTDFGVAWSPAGPRLTATGELLGTPLYMAPEVLDGRADARSDLYSLGVVLYEMVEGRPPYDAGTFLELTHRILHEEPPPPSRLAEPILRCLRKRPEDRYSEARLLAEDLARPRRAMMRKFLAGTAAGLLLLTGAAAALRPEAPPPAANRSPRYLITSSPGGARVMLDGEVLGSTPVELPLPSGAYRLRLSKAGYLDRERLVAGGEGGIHLRLYTPGEIPEGMALVEQPSPLLVDRAPVSCRDYERFLRVTLRPAPAGWRWRRPPDPDAPVTGLTWEEAAAYAAWRGRRLPTIEEWRAAAAASPLREWTSTRGSFGIAVEGAEREVPAETRSPSIGFRCVMDLGGE